MKYLIFDAGPIINFAMNGSLYVLEKLKKEFNGEFLITKEVKYEVIDRPKNIKKFKLEALQIERLFKKNIIKHADLTIKQVNELRNIREKLMNIANSTFKTKDKYIHLIDKGEAATLALSKILDKNNVIVIDERTTRMLVEGPENLRKLLEKKLHERINSNTENYNYFKEFKIIRSTELAYIANKKNFFDLGNKETLDAVLYGLKFKGCSITEEEIEKIKRI